MTDEDRSTLRDREPHPAVATALHYLRGLPPSKLLLYQESFASCAIEGNRLGEVCSGTLRRLIAGDPVSDRYLLGLAWAIRDMEEIGTK